jgi:2-iminobutanoate/2-iminopropanoate deaminase
MRKTCQIIAACVAGAFALTQTASGQDPIAEKKFITRDGTRPSGLFAPGIMVDKTLYIAGKGDYRPNGTYEEKVRNCLAEVRRTLQQAGLDMEHVVKSFCYLEEPEKFPEFNKIYAEFFPNNPPARTTLGVPLVPGESRIEITCIAYSDLSERKSIGTPPPGFPFSPGVQAGKTLYISGKGDHLPDGSHPATFEEQVRQTMRNVETTLKDAGLDFRHVVMSHVYLNNYENYAIANKVYSEFFEFGNEPARKTVFVDWIPGNSDVEITCIATTDLASRKVVRPASMKYGPGEAAMTASPGVWAGPVLYLSGLNGFDPLKGPADQDLDGQVHQMARNHTDVLEAAGLTMEDIVAGWVYLKDMEDYGPMNTIYREYYSRGPGVRTCLMPNSGLEKSAVRVMGSFIAARTR